MHEFKEFKVWLEGREKDSVYLAADSPEDALDIEARLYGFEDYEDMKSWDRYLYVEEVYE